MHSSYVLSQQEIWSRVLQESFLGVAELHVSVMKWMAKARAYLLNAECLAGRKQKFLVRKRYNSNWS